MSNPPDAVIDIVVTIDDTHIGQMNTIVKQLESRGLKVLNSMASIGVVSGKARREDCARFQSIPGIKSVESAGSVQLPPPDSEIQ
jgi:hypothetical protein